MAKKLTDILNKPFAKAKKTDVLANDKQGYQPDKGSTKTRAAVAAHTVDSHDDPYENDFTGGVKTFDRGANRFGHDNVAGDEEQEPDLRSNKLGKLGEEVKVGDNVHLGFRVKGGAGFRGKVTKVEPDAVHIKSHDSDRTFKGPHHLVTKEETVYEELGKTAKASDYIDDFVHSKNKMFSGDSKKQRIKRALGAFYAKKNEETVVEGGTYESSNATDANVQPPTVRTRKPVLSKKEQLAKKLEKFPEYYDQVKKGQDEKKRLRASLRAKPLRDIAR